MSLSLSRKGKDVAIALFISASIFMVDLLTPLWYDAWVLYLVPLFFMFRSAKRPYAYSLIVTLLIITGLFLHPNSTISMQSAVNRITGIFGGWGVSVLLMRLNQLHASMLQSHNELEKRLTDLKKLQDLLSQGKKEWEETFDSINDAITIHDRDFNVIRANKTAERLLGLPFLEILGQKCYRLYHGSDCLSEECPSCAVLKTGTPSVVEKFEPSLNKYIEIKAFPLVQDDQNIKVVHVVRDITDRKKMEEFLQHHAYYDSLTGLPNRLLFMEHVRLRLSYARRNRNRVAILFLDLDHFKYINDSLGHTVGDGLLKVVANRLKACIRESDLVARMGGDEFIVILSDITTAEDAAIVGRKIIASLLESFFIESHKVNTTASIGISIYPDDGEGEEDLLKNADIAMYHAKKQGRNNYEFYNIVMNHKN